MNEISEAMDILKRLNVPRKQQNERSALVLLALLSLKKREPWKNSRKTLIRIHDMMQFIKVQYGKDYAENSRETIRRQTLHQLEKEVGIVERNADDPSRPTNSPNTTWSITDKALAVIKKYGTRSWSRGVKGLSGKTKGPAAAHKNKRHGHSIPFRIKGTKITFSPGKHNELQIDVLSKFRECFCPDSEIIYVGDTAHKMLYLDREKLGELGLEIKKHDILPDIVLLDEKTGRLYLIEAVTSHGPVSNKRQIELEGYFSKPGYRRIFVSAFPDFKEFKRHVDDIAWETEVWISEIPGHMIHFNGHKFLDME